MRNTLKKSLLRAMMRLTVQRKRHCNKNTPLCSLSKSKLEGWGAAPTIPAPLDRALQVLHGRAAVPRDWRPWRPSPSQRRGSRQGGGSVGLPGDDTAAPRPGQRRVALHALGAGRPAAASGTLPSLPRGHSIHVHPFTQGLIHTHTYGEGVQDLAGPGEAQPGGTFFPTSSSPPRL